MIVLLPIQVPMETWRRLSVSDLKANRAVLCVGLDGREQQLFLNRGFAFQSVAWWKASLVTIELTCAHAHAHHAM